MLGKRVTKSKICKHQRQRPILIRSIGQQTVKLSNEYKLTLNLMLNKICCLCSFIADANPISFHSKVFTLEKTNEKKKYDYFSCELNSDEWKLIFYSFFFVYFFSSDSHAVDICLKQLSCWWARRKSELNWTESKNDTKISGNIAKAILIEWFSVCHEIKWATNRVHFLCRDG